MALFFIQEEMDDSLFSSVYGAIRSKQAWDALQVAYQGTTEVKVARKFENFDYECIS